MFITKKITALADVSARRRVTVARRCWTRWFGADRGRRSQRATRRQCTSNGVIMDKWTPTGGRGFDSIS
jgi:hypothetical protein